MRNRCHDIATLVITILASQTLTLSTGGSMLWAADPAFNGCAGQNNSGGKCVGDNKWESVGVGNGWCGACGPSVTHTFSGGQCNGGNDENLTCNSCGVVPATIVEQWQNHAQPTSHFISCMVAHLGVDGSLAVAACMAICCVGTAGTCAGGFGCLGICLGSAAGFIGGIEIGCAMSECANDCRLDDTTPAGETGACS